MIPHLDHADIVSSVADGQRHGSETVFNKSDYESLLQGRYSTTYDSFAHCRKAK